MLRTMKNAIIVQEQEPRQEEVDKVIYGPYKKKVHHTGAINKENNQTRDAAIFTRK